MKYNGFYFWLFSGRMKKVLAEQYNSGYARDIMKRSELVYRELVEQAPDIGRGDPMAYNGLNGAVAPGAAAAAGRAKKMYRGRLYI